MASAISSAELEAYLDEALPAARMAEVEELLRHNETLRDQLHEVIGRRDAGLHTIGAIWRRHRLSCLSRQELANFLLDILPDDEARQVRFHLETAGCRWCQANLADLQAVQQAADQDRQQTRRKKYFQSSVGHLPHE